MAAKPPNHDLRGTCRQLTETLGMSDGSKSQHQHRKKNGEADVAHQTRTFLRTTPDP